MNKYRPIIKEILGKVADLSLLYGPVELRITAETEDGDFVPDISIISASDSVIRGLMADDRIMSMDLEDGELIVMPPPQEMDDLLDENAEGGESKR